jgi:UDP-N-acetylglucosamine 2-epimerase
VVGEKVIFVFEDPHLAYLRRQLDGYPASGPLADGPPYALVTLHKAAHLTKPIVESLWKALHKSDQHAVLLLTPQLSRLLPAISKPPPCVVMLDAQPPRATWRLIAGAQFVLTDSGTLPREAAALGTRSLLLREITGNGELVKLGFARVAGHSASRIAAGIAWARIAPPLQPWPALGAASWTTIIDHAVASLPNA